MDQGPEGKTHTQREDRAVRRRVGLASYVVFIKMTFSSGVITPLTPRGRKILIVSIVSCGDDGVGFYAEKNEGVIVDVEAEFWAFLREMP